MAYDLPTLDQTVQHNENNRGRFVIDTLLRHWILIVIASMTCAITGGVIGSVMNQTHHEYWAETDLFVKKSFWQSPALADLGKNVYGEITPTTLLNRLDTNALSRDIAEILVQDDIANGRHGGGITANDELEARANQLQQNILLEPYNDKGIVRVRVRSYQNTEDAVRTADFAARGLVEYTQNQRADEQQENYEGVRDQLSELRAQLNKAEGIQWDFREQMGFRTHEKVWNDIEHKNNELLEARTEREEIRAKIRDLDAELLDNGKSLPAALGNVTDAVVQDILTELDALRREALVLGVVWKPGYPELDRLEAEMEDKKQAALVAIDELNGGAGGSSLWQKRQNLYRQKVNLETRSNDLDVRTATLEKMIEEFLVGLPDLANKSFEYEQLTHEATQVRTQFNRMLDKEFELRAALSRGRATVERRAAAIGLPISYGKSSPLSATILIGVLIGLALSFGYSFLHEMNDTSIKNANDLRTYIGLEDIGTIPDMHSGRGRQSRRREAMDKDIDPVAECIVTQHDPKSPVSEAYRSLRTNFQFATLKKGSKTVMVTSSLPGEGKTTTAVNFAVTMSDLGKKVLIVDTDLRRPNVHRTLCMERDLGLADVLQDLTTIEKVIRPTKTENLYMISSGRVPQNPSELISSEKMAELMIDLSQEFDIVVCDAPSTLVVTDPVLLAMHVDSIILVVSVGRTRRETVMRAKKIIETANPNIAGVVLNGLKATSRHYYYYYYYYDERARRGRRSGPPMMTKPKPLSPESGGSSSDGDSAP